MRGSIIRYARYLRRYCGSWSCAVVAQGTVPRVPYYGRYSKYDGMYYMYGMYGHDLVPLFSSFLSLRSLLFY